MTFLFLISYMFPSCDSVSRRRLRVTYNAIARYMLISHFARLISNVTFENLMNSRTLIFLHKFIYKRQPPYLYEILIFSWRENRINSIKYNKVVSQQHFFIHSIGLWNQLPPQIEMISNANHFKTAIFKHFA